MIHDVAMFAIIFTLVYLSIISLKFACFVNSHPGIGIMAAKRLFIRLPASPLTRWFRVGKFTYMRLEFKWQDMWIGGFIQMNNIDSAMESWFIVIPMFPIHIRKTVL